MIPRAAGTGLFLAATLVVAAGPEARARQDWDCRDLLDAAFLDEFEDLDGLLAAGTPVDCVDGEGQTALMIAAEGGSVVSVRLLLNAGAQAGRKDVFGRSALSRALDKARRFDDPRARGLSMAYKGVIRMLRRAGAAE